MQLWLEITIAFACISIAFLAAAFIYTVISRQTAFLKEQKSTQITIMNRLDRLDRLQYTAIRQNQSRQMPQEDVVRPVGIAARRPTSLPEIDGNARDELKIPTWLKGERDDDLNRTRSTMENTSKEFILKFNSRKEMFKFVSDVADIDIRPGIKGAGNNCIAVPSRIMTTDRFKDVVNRASGTYEQVDKNSLPRPRSNDLAGLAEFCEAQIALLP